MKTLSYTEALREALCAEMRRDDSVLLMGEDIGAYGGAFGVTRGLLDEFGPERVTDTPISEGGFVGVAVGAALAGLRPVVEIMFMDFIALAADQLLNQAAKLRYVFGAQASCPMVLRTPAGTGRCYGPTHSQNLEAWFAHVPGLKVVAPATPADAYGLLRAAIRDDNPVLFVEHKLLYGERGPVDTEAIVPIGAAHIAREGSDVTIVAWSGMVAEAMRAASVLADEDVDAEVVDLRTLSPLDADTVIESAQRTGRLVIVEEAPGTGGLSGEIGFRVFEEAYDCLDAPIRRVTTPDIPIPASPVLEAAARPDAGKIARAVRELMEI